MQKSILKLCLPLAFSQLAFSKTPEQWVKQSRFSIANFNQENGVCFKSDESSHNLGTVRNCVLLKEDQDSQFWMMKQDIQLRTGKINNLIGIVVQQKQATYFEFERDTFERSGVLKPQVYKVPCAMCHPSGPRAIRPDMSDAQSLQINRERLDHWNEKITQLQQIESRVSHKEYESGFLPTVADEVPLNIRACKDCHSEGGVRRSLTSAHLPSIDFLFKERRVMPPHGYPLNQKEEQCVLSWIRSPHSNDCEKDSTQAKVLHSFAKVKVSTTLHDFEIENLPAVFSKTCNQTHCAIDGRIELSALKSGVQARDFTIRSILGVEKFPVITFKTDLPKRKLFQGSLPVQLQMKDRSAFQSVDVSCNYQFTNCSFKTANLDLQQWQIETPNLFGIGVKKIEVSGELSVTEADQLISSMK